MLKRTFGLIITCILFYGCSSGTNKEIVHEEEIRAYLDHELWIDKSGMDQIISDIEFWSAKLSEQDTPVYKLKLASAYQMKFSVTKEVELLGKSEALLQEVNEYYNGNNAGVLQALAQLSITKHDFQSAISYAEEALKTGEDKLLTYLILFDSSMETGDFEYARDILEHKVVNKSSFNYLIRKSQFEDYSGNAAKSIEALRNGAKRISYSSVLSAWTQSNLGDRLGHEGNVDDSYSFFKQALNQEQAGASYLHSLKGIAYIAYANDGNTEFAKEIIEFISKRSKSPDMYLFLSEIAEYEGDDELKVEMLKKFYNQASYPKYYGMYDVELIQIAATEFGDFEVAEILLDKELKNRTNPITYSLQAWVKYQMGEGEEARRIIENEVLGKTYEPLPAFQAGVILKETGEIEAGRKLLLTAKESSFELGPLTIAEINRVLN